MSELIELLLGKTIVGVVINDSDVILELDNKEAVRFRSEEYDSLIVDKMRVEVVTKNQHVHVNEWKIS